MRRRRLVGPLVALLTPCLSPAMAAHAESYTVTATNTLAVDREGRLVQTWTVDCAATDPGASAEVTLSGKDLRFFVAEEEPLELGADPSTHPPGPIGGRYEYEIVPGARVMARLTARCGTDDVFDAVSIDSAPVTLAPVLGGPERIVAVDTLEDIADGALPVGGAVELLGLRIEASPRGSEVVNVAIRGAGVDTAFALGPTDFVDGAAVVAPQVVPTIPGTIEVTAELLGVSSTPLTFVATSDAARTEAPPGDETLDDGAAGCAASGATPAGLVLMGGAFRRRRRRP